MHQRTCVLLSLLAGLWLMGPATTPVDAQLPKEGAFMMFVGDTRELQMSQMQFISAVRSENPKVAGVSLRKDDPRVVLLTGISEGVTRVFLTDAKGKTEEYTVTVSTAASALQMQMLQRMAEQRRLALEQMIRQTVPTANVQVLVFGYTVVLKGTILRAEDAQVIMELARSVYPEFQVPGSQTAAGAGPPPPPPGQQPLPQGQGQGPLIINAMRVGGEQLVMVEVVVARVNRSELRNMTFNFMVSAKDYYFGSAIKSPQTVASSILPGIGGAAAALASGGSNLPFGFLTSKNSFIGFLEALRTEGVAKFNALPSVTTLSGRPGFVLSGGEVPVLTSTGTGAPSVTYKQFGTVVNFLPIVLGDGKIYMDIRPEVSARNAANDLFVAGVTPTVVPGFDNRSAQVTVMMEDGETIAIGGLIQHTVNGTTIKVPVLGDLPFFGAAFRSVSYNETEEELLILVTPRLVHPMACCQLPKYLPGEETRSVDDFELFLEGILEAPRGPRTALDGLHYTASHQGGPTAEAFPCAENGFNCGLFPGRGRRCTTCGNGQSNGQANGHPTTNGSGVSPMPPANSAATQNPGPTPRELPFSPVPFNPVPSGPAPASQAPFSVVPTQPHGGLPAVPRLPQGALMEVPPPAALGPVIEDE